MRTLLLRVERKAFDNPDLEYRRLLKCTILLLHFQLASLGGWGGGYTWVQCYRGVVIYPPQLPEKFRQPEVLEGDVQQQQKRVTSKQRQTMQLICNVC